MDSQKESQEADASKSVIDDLERIRQIVMHAEDAGDALLDIAEILDIDLRA